MTDTKLTLWMGTQTDEYKQKLEIIGKRLLARGIDVTDKKKGGVSHSAVVRYLIDQATENQ